MTYVLLAILLGVITLNVVATVAVLRASGHEPERRRLQILFTWLLPIAGAALVLSVVPDPPVKRLKGDGTSWSEGTAESCGCGGGNGGDGGGGH